MKVSSGTCQNLGFGVGGMNNWNSFRINYSLDFTPTRIIFHSSEVTGSSINISNRISVDSVYAHSADVHFIQNCEYEKKYRIFIANIDSNGFNVYMHGTGSDFYLANNAWVAIKE